MRFLMSSGVLCHTLLFREQIVIVGINRCFLTLTSFVGDQYEYRSADGSYNNPTLPWLGAANTAYARSIAPMTIQPGSLPDPGLIFDSIMAREEFTPHPNKVSSVFFAWASLVIHGNRYLLLDAIYNADCFTRHLSNGSPEPTHFSNFIILRSLHSLWR